MKKTPLFSAVSMAALMVATPVAATEVDDLSEWINEGNADLSFRYRLENVDQDGFNKDALASTLLTKLTYKTASFKGWSAGLELTNVSVIGKETYNNTINGNKTRPVVADPDGTEFNQGYIQYATDMFTVKAGRQGVNLDDQRFVGTVGWRQNDQTVDAGVFILTPGKDVTAIFGQVWNVNRIFGDDHPFGDLDTNTQLVNVSYNGLSFGKLTAYGYFIDLNDQPVFGLSSKTIGVRFAGKRDVSDGVKVGYQLEYASQGDFKDNPNDFNADFWHAGISASTNGFSATLDYELLGSDNGFGFQTPLATLHKFNGWADKFLSTPAGGLQDIYASVGYKVPEGSLKGLTMKAVYHSYDSDVGDVDYGSEWNFLVSKKINKHFTAAVKAAFYNADSFATDTTKLWLTVGAKF